MRLHVEITMLGEGSVSFKRLLATTFLGFLAWSGVFAAIGQAVALFR